MIRPKKAYNNLFLLTFRTIKLMSMDYVAMVAPRTRQLKAHVIILILNVRICKPFSKVFQICSRSIYDFTRALSHGYYEY